jgi:DNA-nicking Smr family endonuclease
MRKKEKKTPQGTGEFASKPFKALKGFAASAGASNSKAPAPVPPPPASHDADDSALFLRAVADARRLHPVEPASNKTLKKPTLTRQTIAEEERHIFLDAVDRLRLDVKFHDELPEDVTPLRQTGSNRLRQLKQGAIRIGLELDLHGLARDEALESLARFITGAYNRGQKAVLVITGKGNNSPDEPVLRGAVASWLRDRGKGMVAEFSPAPRQMGGSGAYVIFLKEKG